MEALTAPWVSKFIGQLTAAGFKSYRERRTKILKGSVTVPWLDPDTKNWQRSRHEIEIRLHPGFPFRKPSVRPIGDDPVRGSRHQEPGEEGYLCLWLDEDWDSATSADELLHRVADWFRHYHRNDWPPSDTAPDLHLYFPSQDSRPVMITGRDWPPETGDVGWFHVWDAGTSRSFAGRPVPVGDRSRRLDDPVAQRYGVDASQPRGHHGLWLRLSREPNPFPTLGRMLDEVDAARCTSPGTTRKDLARVAYSGKPSKTVTATIALGYLAAGGTEHWLFIRSQLVGLASKAHTGDGINQRIVEAYETVPSGPAALMRRVGPVAHALEDKHAVVFGVGAIGGHLSVLLAEDGVPKLTLVDADRMRSGNAVRHVAGLRYAGKLKLQAVRDVILDHAPYCDVVVEPATWDPNDLRDIVRKADVVVDATANRSFGHLLNSICIPHRVPLITIASYRRGAVGRVRLIRRGQDACLECCEGPGGYAETGAEDYVVIPSKDEGVFLEEGCGTPTVETSSTDLIGIVAAGARLARDVLTEHQPLGGENHLLIVQDILDDATGLLAIAGTHSQAIPPRSDCRVCGAKHT